MLSVVRGSAGERGALEPAPVLLRCLEVASVWRLAALGLLCDAGFVGHGAPLPVNSTCFGQACWAGSAGREGRAHAHAPRGCSSC